MKHLTIFLTFNSDDVEQARAYAEQEFTLAETQADGATLRDHLLAVEKITRQTPKELKDLLECPREIQECWHWFLTLNQTRAVGFGASPITYTEMRNYFTLMNIEPNVEEINLIKVFDSIAMEHISKQQANKKK